MNDPAPINLSVSVRAQVADVPESSVKAVIAVMISVFIGRSPRSNVGFDCPLASDGVSRFGRRGVSLHGGE